MLKPVVDQTRRILSANTSVYGDGHEVDQYLARSNHAARVQLVIETAVRRAHEGPTAKNGLGIELGSSGGQISERLRLRGLEVVGGDVSLESLRLGFKRGIPGVALDATASLPFRTGTLRFIVACELIEHLFDTMAFLSECRRTLEPNGFLVLSTPNLATLSDRMRFVIGCSPKQVDPLHRYRYLHIRAFTAGLLTRVLKASGFRDISIASQVVEIPLPWTTVRSIGLAKLVPGLGRSLIASCRA